MSKTLRIFLVSFLLSTLLFSQTDYSQQYIEEYGFDRNTIISSYDELQMALGWTSITASPEPFGRSIGGTIGNFFYIFGGQANSSMARAYNLTTNSWVASTAATYPAYNAGFVVAAGELYKISGTGATNNFEKFTPNGTGTGTWASLTAGPTDIMNSQNAAVWDGGDNIYVHSSNYSTTAPLSYLAKYSISGNSWSMLAPSPNIKRYPGLAYYNGFVYLIGGLVDAGDDGTICLKYEIATNAWTTIAYLPDVVNFCKWSTTVVGNKIVLVSSGGGYSGYPANPKVFYYDVSSNAWTYDGNTPITRGLALASYLPTESKIFFGGGNEGNVSSNYQATCWLGEGGFIPVELTSFTADRNDNSVFLNWSTATETNNYGFEIERQSTADNWEKIGFVPGYGTTTELRSYSFKDDLIHNPSHILFYRLKQIDFDGSIEYSDIVKVTIEIPLNFSLEQNYPNPFNPSTTLSFAISQPSFVSLKIFDVLGNEVATLVNEYKSEGRYEVEFGVKSGVRELSSGVYFSQLKSGDFIKTNKMLLLK